MLFHFGLMLLLAACGVHCAEPVGQEEVMTDAEEEKALFLAQIDERRRIRAEEKKRILERLAAWEAENPVDNQEKDRALRAQYERDRRLNVERRKERDRGEKMAQEQAEADGSAEKRRQELESRFLEIERSRALKAQMRARLATREAANPVNN